MNKAQHDLPRFWSEQTLYELRHVLFLVRIALSKSHNSFEVFVDGQYEQTRFEPRPEELLTGYFLQLLETCFFEADVPRDEMLSRGKSLLLIYIQRKLQKQTACGPNYSQGTATSTFRRFGPLVPLFV